MMKDLFQLLKHYNLTPNSHYLMYCLEHNLKIDLPISYSTEMHKLQLEGYLDDKFKITEKAKKILIELSTIYFKKYNVENQSVIQKTEVVNASVDQKYKENLIKYKELFPTSKEAGKVVRTNLKDIDQRMTWFIKNYPEYTWDDILKATKMYIESLNGDYLYCINSTYFIKKDDKNKNSISSLANWCETAKEEADQLVKVNPFEGFNKLI